MTSNTRRTLLFVGLTFLFSWTLVGVFAASGGVWASKSSYPVTILYMFIPGLAALFVQKFIAHEPLRESDICMRLARIRRDRVRVEMLGRSSRIREVLRRAPRAEVL